MNFKKIGYKILTYIPGVGLIAYGVKEIKTRKGKSPWYDIGKPEDRKALGVYALEVGYFALAIAWKVYVGKGLATHNWNPFDFSPKDKTEQIKSIPENKLEKAINYEKLLK